MILPTWKCHLFCHRASIARTFLPATATPLAIHHMEEYVSIRVHSCPFVVLTLPLFFFRAFRVFRG